jgi:hypothetical protein
MWPTFNIVMRIVSSLIGIAMILMSTVWMLQGLNLAFRVGTIQELTRLHILGLSSALTARNTRASSGPPVGAHRLRELRIFRPRL